MPTTTEPPYLHKSSGIAARNGTSTHTITFTTDGSAPFTPTNGSLLVFTIFGPVTHNNSGGWTKRLSPVNTGELTVFTITASSTNSITITNNASNYPNVWEVKEYPAGSTWVGTGAGDSQTAATAPPTLTSGLVSGTPRVIESAVGLVSAVSGDAPTGTTWSAPWVEDSDQFTVHNATSDGAYMSTGHQINNTTTSVSPNPSGFSSGLAVGDRQAVTFAIDAAVVSGTTPVSSSLDLRWKVSNLISQASDLRWIVRNAVTQGLDLPWAVRSVVSAPLDVRWAVRQAVSASLDLSWRQFQLASSPLDLRWASAGQVASSIDLRWAVRGVVSGTLDLRWAVTNQISALLSMPWVVRAKVTSDCQLLWVVQGAPESGTRLPSIGRAELTGHVTAYPDQITAYL